MTGKKSKDTRQDIQEKYLLSAVKQEKTKSLYLVNYSSFLFFILSFIFYLSFWNFDDWSFPYFSGLVARKPQM